MNYVWGATFMSSGYDLKDAVDICKKYRCLDGRVFAGFFNGAPEGDILFTCNRKCVPDFLDVTIRNK